jgi:hypothetical protein
MVVPVTAESETLDFKFKWLDANGNEAGFLSKKGRLEKDELILDKERLPIVAIFRARTRMNRIILEVAQKGGGLATAVFAVTGGKPVEVFRAINRKTSANFAQCRKETLEKEGKGQLFRTATCSVCQSTIDLSGLPDSPQIYCLYCDTLYGHPAAGQAPLPDEQTFRCCDHCGYFSQPKAFTSFFFVFLFVFYYYSYRRVTMCNSCMRGEAWKMLLANFVFILGTIPSIVQLIRAYFGGSYLSKTYAGLDDANARAKKRDMEGAVAKYREVIQRLPYAAGVWLNTGLALSEVSRNDEAIAAFRSALRDCANYYPAYQRLHALLEKLGKKEELQTLEASFV